MALVKRSALSGRPSSGGAKDNVPAPSGRPAPRSKAKAGGGKQTAVQRLGSAAQEMSGGVTEAAGAAEELRRALEQISTASEEAAGASQESLAVLTHLMATFAQARHRAESAQGSSEQVQNLVVETAAQIEQSVAAVQTAATRHMASLELMSVLEQHASDIGDIGGMVARMADQTGMLALNAAIEAARAGEAGLGFAVVADEVRALAETSEQRSGDMQGAAESVTTEVRGLATRVKHSADAAREQAMAGKSVTATLADIRGHMSAVSAASSDVVRAAVEAETAVREAQRGAETIASAAEQQSAAANEAQRAVQQQSVALEESSRTAEALAEQAEVLQKGDDEVATIAESISSAAEELSSAVQEIAGSAGEILAALDQISRGSQLQAAATHQAATALAQIEKSASLAQQQTRGSLEKVERAERGLEEARQAVSKLVEGMRTAHTEAGETGKMIGQLERTGRRIEKLVDAIALIAVQTTMLAVSGSVEAARSGEAGRGFATVSNDIRALARESGENADRVRDAVRTIQDTVTAMRRETELISASVEAECARGAALIEKLARAIADVSELRAAATEIMAGAETILGSVSEVMSGAQQIASAAEETAAASAQSAAAARQQAAGAEDLAAAIEEIAELAEELSASGSG